MPGNAMHPTASDKAVCQDTRGALVALLVKLIRPLVLLMLKHGMTAYEFSEISRWVFVKTAMDRRRFAVRDRDVWSMTKSRCAVLTGLTRRTVDDMTRRHAPPVEEARHAFHRGARVLDAWLREPGYQDDAGRPRDLDIKGPRGSLQWLVRHYCRDIPVRAMLDELEYRGCVIRPDRETVRFVTADFNGPVLAAEELDQLGNYAAHFLALLERRLDGNQPIPRFAHITTGPIAPGHREPMQRMLANAAQAFTAQVQRDLAASPKALTRENTETAVFGIYHGFV